jgi:hypothetical protein
MLEIKVGRKGEVEADVGELEYFEGQEGVSEIEVSTSQPHDSITSSLHGTCLFIAIKAKIIAKMDKTTPTTKIPQVHPLISFIPPAMRIDVKIATIPIINNQNQKLRTTEFILF